MSENDKHVCDDCNWNNIEKLKQLESENAALRDWKESMISVMPPMQEIGKALGLPLGSSIHDKILPGIIALSADLATAKEVMKKMVEALEMTAPKHLYNCDGIDARFPDCPKCTRQDALPLYKKEFGE